MSPQHERLLSLRENFCSAVSDVSSCLTEMGVLYKQVLDHITALQHKHDDVDFGASPAEIAQAPDPQQIQKLCGSCMEDSSSSIIQLNVGGTRFATSADTLCNEPDSFFHGMVSSGAWQADMGDCYFVDRDPEFFRHILDYLRDGRLYMEVDRLTCSQKQKFSADVNFYQIEPLLDMFCTIGTVAGTGQDGEGGDCGPAASASLHWPAGIAYCSRVLYIADSGNQRVRAIDLRNGIGTINTVAGNGEEGTEGDGEAAFLATLTWPRAVAVADNKVFIVDMDAHCVRIVDQATGLIHRLAGSSSEGGGGGGGSAAGYSGDGGLAVSAQLSSPFDLAVQDGIVYIADSDNHCIRAVNITTGVISTVAGCGSSGYSGDGGKAQQAQLCRPMGLAVHKNRLFISDDGNAVVRALNLNDGSIQTVVGTGEKEYSGDGGPARQACLMAPLGLAVRHESLYIADRDAHVVRVVNLRTGIIRTLCGTGVRGFSGDGKNPRHAQLDRPVDVAVGPNCLFISDMLNHRIRVIHWPTEPGAI
eukprot:TRINITY_DN63734_c1_g2_i1.p1 TRINITY_DN63734_c1_g2~~TRINITY_DN63734_c1_g2_i1.p1  ORF type:complete len:531 (-),score=43.05 TRINITY_DN63734_c1_g2_i1:115-1707(-)